MFHFDGWRWLRRRANRIRGARRGRPPRRRPALEALEDRTVPATLTWTGTLNNNWNTVFEGGATNWTSSDNRQVALPQNGDDLVFPAGAANLANNNNISGLSVRSITFTGPGYGIAGNALDLTGSLSDQQTTPSNDGSTDASITLGINLPNDITVNGPAGKNVLALGGTISGPGGMTVAGSGTVTLGGDNTYQGTTLVSDGVLEIQTTNALGSPAAGTTVSAGATLTLLSASFGGVSNVPEPLTLSGPGFQGGAALVSSSTQGIFPNSWSGPITLNAESAVQTNAPLFITGLISGPGGLDVLGPAPLSLAGTGNNSYAGTTTVDGGVLELRQSGVAVPGNLVINPGPRSSGVCDILGNEQIADGARVTIGPNSVLGVNGNSETIGSLAGVGEVILDNSSSGDGNQFSPRPGTLLTGADNTSTTYAGVISGSGGNVVKVGGGAFVLTGANTYSGTTTVNGGTLRVDGSQPGSAVVVNAGGTLGGHGTVGPTAVNGGGTVAPGDSPGVLTVQGGIGFGPGSVLFAEINGPAAGTGYDQLRVAGTVSLNGPLLRLALGFTPAPGQDFVLIANDGGGTVGGTFAGAPEDALLAHAGAFFDVSYAGGRGRDVDVLSLSRGDLFVRGLFADFGAPSTRGTRAPFEAQVDGGQARLAVAQNFLASPARRLGEVLQFYQVFGQPLDGRQVRYLVELLKGVPAGQVLVEFLTSSPFRRRHRSNAAFLRALFTGLLGHPPGRHDLLGHHTLAFYLRELNAGTVSRASLARQLLSSDEVYGAAVVQNFTALLGAPPTPAQLQGLVGQLEAGGLSPDALSGALTALDTYVDFFIARAATGRAPGVVLANV